MLLIKNSTLYTMVDNRIELGDILVNNGKIVKIGAGIVEPNAEIMHADGLIALPGLIDTHTHIGGFNPISPDCYGFERNDRPCYATGCRQFMGWIYSIKTSNMPIRPVLRLSVSRQEAVM